MQRTFHLIGRALIGVALMTPAAEAAGQALVRLDRTPGLERNTLLDAGLPVVEEMNACFLALGDSDEILRRAAVAGWTAEVIDDEADEGAHALLGLMPGTPEAATARCGQTVWAEDGWRIVKTSTEDQHRCMSEDWFFRPLNRRVLGRTTGPPEGFGGPREVTPDPLVEDMVGAMTAALVQEHWERIVGASSTRYSTSSGCANAALTVENLFTGFGLATQTQTHTSGHAPNVIATLPGTVNPDQVVIAVGHLDDMPSSGSAPGADDNASGSAMVTALAEVMSCYEFANTVKFLVVTGEEFGLYGSEYYAAHNPAGETILAVFNGDMISYEGDGLPGPEDLDVNLNPSSAWLGPLMSGAASAYSTGCAVNAFQCADMAYSDHWPFWQRGWSALCGITDNLGFCGQAGGYAYYHTSNDTIENNGDPSFYSAAVRTYLASVAHLADPVASLTPAPNGVAAVGDGDNRIEVSWNPVGLGLAYTVLRAPGGCDGLLDWVEVGQTNQTSLVDTTASGGLTYAWAVRSSETGGHCNSSLSACVEGATTGPCTEPPAFAGLAAVEDNHETTCGLTLSWPAATPYCGGAGYNVYRSTDPAFVPSEASLIAADLDGLTYVDTDGLVSGEPYFYVVRAADSISGSEDDNLIRRSGSASGPFTLGTWTDDGGDTGTAALAMQPPWSVVAAGGHAGPAVYATGDYGNSTCTALTTPLLHLGADSTLSFWSAYDIETSYDKGEVQISTDGGTSWSRLELAYPASSGQGGDACGLPSGTTYFTGADLVYGEYDASLAPWADGEIQLRWILSSDSWITADGWWVDDVVISDVMVPGQCATGADGEIFRDGFDSGTTESWSSAVP